MFRASVEVREMIRASVIPTVVFGAVVAGSSLFIVGATSANAAPLVLQDEVQRLINEARQHMRNAEWQRAIDAWTSVLVRMDDNQEAREGLARARAALDAASTLDDVADEIVVLRQRARVEFDASITRANEMLRVGDFEGAKREVITAKVRVNQSRPVLSEPEFQAMTTQADALIVRIDRERIEADLVRRQDQITAAERDKQTEQARQQEERQRLITENLRRARQLQNELKYAEALQVVEEVLFMDQHNPSALILRDALEVIISYREMVTISRDRELGYRELHNQNWDRTIPPRRNLVGPGRRSTSGVVEYPEDWEELSLRRDYAAGFRESDIDRQARLALERPIPIDIAGSTFGDVVAYLRQVTGVQIHADWRNLDLDSGIRPEDEVTISLGQVTGLQAITRILEQISQEPPAQYTIEDGMLIISSEQALRKRTFLVVYDIRDLLFQVPYFDNAPEFDIEAAGEQGGGRGGQGGGGGGGFGGGGGGGGGQGGGGGGGGIFGSPGADPARRSRQELVQDIVDIIENTVDPLGWIDSPIQELNGNLIITNTARVHREIEGLLGQLRRIRALQINIEGRLLSVAMDWFEQIGVDLDLYFNTNNRMFQQAKAVDPNFQLKDFFGPGGLPKDAIVFDSPTATNIPGEGAPPGVPGANTFGTGYLVGVPTGGPPPTDITYVTGPVGTPIRQTSGFSPVGVTQNSFDAIAQLAAGGLSDFALAAAGTPALAMGVSFLDDIQVDLLVTATQADRRNVVMTAPRLTLFNGQRSWVAVSNRTAYLANLIPATGDSAGAFQPEIDSIDDGFVMDIEAVISADRRYVTMTVAFTINENVQFATQEIQGAAGGGGTTGGNAANFSANIQLPQVSITAIRTTVSVPDKGTILLGGQRSVKEFEVESGVPVLSKIPFVNRFFANRLTSKEEKTLLLLIRPEIIIQQENEDILFPKLSGQLGGGF